jgi:hypothetical protein
MIGAFGCHHQPSLRNAPGQRPSRVMSQRCPTRTSGAQESYHGIGRFYALRYWSIAQVAQTCYHPVTNTPGNCISIHYTTSGSQLFTCRHSRTRTLDSPSVSAAKPTLTLSPVELLKITPESRTFQNIIYEPRVWGGRGSFSVAFLKFSYNYEYQFRY